MWRFRDDFPEAKSSLEVVARGFGKRRTKACHSALEDAFLVTQIASAYHHMDKDGRPKWGDPIPAPKPLRHKAAGKPLTPIAQGKERDTLVGVGCRCCLAAFTRILLVKG